MFKLYESSQNVNGIFSAMLLTHNGVQDEFITARVLRASIKKAVLYEEAVVGSEQLVKFRLSSTIT